jgi:hypothetical protein
LLNWYYIAAVIFAALTAYFSYLGANASSNSDSTKIVGALKRVEDKLESITSVEQPHQGTASELSSIEGEFDSIAEKFYKDITLEVEQQRFKDTSKTISQLKQSRLIEPHVHTLELAAQQLTQAFNKRRSAPPISIEIPTFPTNIFEGDKYHMVLSFPNSRYWVFFFREGDNEKLQLRIAQTKNQHPISNGQLSPIELGLGRAFFLEFSGDQSSFLIYGDLPADMKVRILGDMTAKLHGIGDLDAVAKTLLERIMKYEALEESLITRAQS